MPGSQYADPALPHIPAESGGVNACVGAGFREDLKIIRQHVKGIVLVLGQRKVLHTLHNRVGSVGHMKMHLGYLSETYPEYILASYGICNRFGHPDMELVKKTGAFVHVNERNGFDYFVYTLR